MLTTTTLNFTHLSPSFQRLGVPLPSLHQRLSLIHACLSVWVVHRHQVFVLQPHQPQHTSVALGKGDPTVAAFQDNDETTSTSTSTERIGFG